MTMTLVRVRIRRGLFRFEVMSSKQEVLEQYLAEFLYPPDGSYDHDYFSKWHLSRFTYHTHRFGKPLKVSPAQQRPRFKRIGYFDSVKACEDEVRRIMEVAKA